MFDLYKLSKKSKKFGTLYKLSLQKIGILALLPFSGFEFFLRQQ